MISLTIPLALIGCIAAWTSADCLADSEGRASFIIAGIFTGAVAFLSFAAMVAIFIQTVPS